MRALEVMKVALLFGMVAVAGERYFPPGSDQDVRIRE